MNTLWTGLLTLLTFAGLTIAFVSEVTEYERTGDFDLASEDSLECSQPKLDGADGPGKWASFAEMHEHYTHQFVESEGFGIKRILTFDEPEYRTLLVNDVPHRVSNLQLIGLLNGNAVVYDAKWLGMTRRALKHYEKRPPTSVESASLARLQEGAPYAWLSEQPDENTDDLASAQETEPAELNSGNAEPKSAGTLVAGLRATQKCMSCHEAQEGELLGAFLYEMTRQPSLQTNIQMDLNQQLKLNALASPTDDNIDRPKEVVVDD